VGDFLKRIFFLLIVSLFLNIGVKAIDFSDISANSAVVMEQTTKSILFSKNSKAKMKPASTTKILTAICALEYGNIDDIVTVSVNAANQEGSSMYIEAGEKIKLESLIYGLMLNSGNDAAVAIAEHISGSEKKFSELMNKKAKEIGAKSCNFVTPNGLDDDNHFVTAEDLALITAYALKNEKFCEIVKTRTKLVTTEKNVKKYLTNHNKMLGLYNGCIGVKTGFTKASGRTLVTAAEKNGIKIIAVTLKAPNDWNDHKKLLDYGFSIVEEIELVSEGKILKKAEVKNGVKDYCELVCEKGYNDIKIKNNKDKFEVKYDIKRLKAPVIKNEVAGRVYVIKNGKRIFETKLLAAENVEKIYTEDSYWDIFKRFFEI